MLEEFRIDFKEILEDDGKNFYENIHPQFRLLIFAIYDQIHVFLQFYSVISLTGPAENFMKIIINCSALSIIPVVPIFIFNLDPEIGIFFLFYSLNLFWR